MPLQGSRGLADLSPRHRSCVQKLKPRCCLRHAPSTTPTPQHGNLQHHAASGTLPSCCFAVGRPRHCCAFASLPEPRPTTAAPPHQGQQRADSSNSTLSVLTLPTSPVSYSSPRSRLFPFLSLPPPEPGLRAICYLLQGPVVPSFGAWTSRPLSVRPSCRVSCRMP
jgi:hypothetical protein